MSGHGDSGSDSPGPWRVRFGGKTFRVKDQDSLRRLADTGKVPADAVVQEPGEDGWLPLARVVGKDDNPDPWSAWDDLDGDAEQSLPPGGVLPPVKARPSPPPASTVAPQTPSAPPATPYVQPDLARPRKAAPPVPPTLSVSMLAPGEEGDEDPATADSQIPLALGAGPESPDQPPGHVASAVSPPPAPPRQAEPHSRPRSGGAGTVIPFPGPRPGRTQTRGPHALDTEPVPFPERQPLPPPPMDLGPLRRSGRDGPARRKDGGNKGANWWRIAAFAAFGLVALGSARWYVALYNSPDVGPKLVRSTVPPGAEGLVSPPSTDPVVAAQTSLEDQETEIYRQLDRELRTHLRAGTMDYSDAGSLEDALLVELNQVRLDVSKVDVTVLSRVDDAEDGALESIEMRIQLRSDGQELDRELAAASLVVGKYARHDELIVPVFEVAFEGVDDNKLLRKRIDVDLAEQYYLGRLALDSYLEALTR